MSDSRTGNQFAAHSVKVIDDQLAGLNAKQREAVEYGIKPGKTKDIGPLLVIAGAGSGKTQTLAHRAANLLINGADPQHLLLLTFTRRAAREMTQRAGRIASSQKAKGSRGR